MRAVLVHRAQRARGDVVLDGDVAGERGAVGENAVVANLGVVADVRVGHDEAAGADLGDASAAFSPARDGDGFANDGVVADDTSGGLALVLQVLRRDADAREGEDADAVADLRVAVEDHVRDQLAVFPERNVRADGAERPDGRGGGDDGAVGDDRAGVDRHRVIAGPGWLAVRWVSFCRGAARAGR